MNLEIDLTIPIIIVTFIGVAAGEFPGLKMGWSAGAQSVSLWVADDGEGIAPADLTHIFEPFYRGDRSRSRRQGGTGLGLAVVQAIVQAHGGKIEVVSQLNQGARFTVVLPI